MKIQYARERIRRWLSPVLVVPSIPHDVAPTLAPEVTPSSCPLILGELRGYRRDGVLVIVTPRGTEMPISPLSDWLVIDVVRYLAVLDRLPELAPGSRRV